MSFLGVTSASSRILLVCIVLGCTEAFLWPSVVHGQGSRCKSIGAQSVQGRLDAPTRNRNSACSVTDTATVGVRPLCAGVALPLDKQPYKVVTAWRYEESAVDVPWKALGDVLFEMGAVSVAVDVAKPAASAGDMQRDEERYGRRPWLTFTVTGARDVGAALDDACALVGSPRCFEALDWDEDPVACSESWEATACSDGFENIVIGKLLVSPVQRYEDTPPGFQQMKLLEGQGWGDGEHPSTWLCLDFLERVVQSGEEVIDYGTGSGVLATAAALLGAARVTAVDVDFEILAHATQNFLVNGVSGEVSALHTREVSIGQLAGEVVVSNILPGPMRRLMPVLVLAVKEGGFLCLSGLRPIDAPIIKREFGKYVEWSADLETTRTSPKWGEWVRLVGRPKAGLAVGGALRTELERDLSELAVA